MMILRLVIAGVVVHVILFYSIFDIYFTSPLVHGMTPYRSASPAPAKRLVLFVADGLRADKFFELEDGGESRSPYLRSIITGSGAWGVSHTRVPTESRPGHVALTAGFYEDVSAVAKGWKENPVEFDSVFNESMYTWSWGSPDILPMFAKGASGDHVLVEMYPSESEDFASSDSSLLDTWVFDKVENFLQRAATNSTLREMVSNGKTILFLHLLGIDTNGHSHKPYSREYLENIKVVDKGIQGIVKLINDFFQDNKTAFVYTSDHGMTNWGSHGTGLPSETLTPLVAWGAGVRRSLPSLETPDTDSYTKEWKLSDWKRSDVMQADIAPLMASLIGIAYPLNSVGILPLDYLDVSPADKTENLLANALQIVAQFKVKMEEKRQTTLSGLFKPYGKLSLSVIADRMRNVRLLMKDELYDDAIKMLYRLIDNSLEGLTYYHSYDRLYLGVSISCGFIGWVIYLITLLVGEQSKRLRLDQLDDVIFQRRIRFIFVGAALIVVVLLFVQSLPWTHYVYCLLPVILWHQVTERYGLIWSIMTYIKSVGYFTSLGYIVVGTGAIEIIVLSFFYREILSVGLLCLGLWPVLFGVGAQQLTRFLWMVSCTLLAIFPLLPVVGRQANYSLVLLAGVALTVIGITIIILKIFQRSNFKSASLVVLIMQTVIIAISSYIVLSTSTSIATKQGTPFVNRVISWSILGSSVILPLLTETYLMTRISSIVLAFSAPYILISIAHEALFCIVLCLLLVAWLKLEHEYSGHSKQVSNITGNLVSSTQGKLEDIDFQHQTATVNISRTVMLLDDCRCAYIFIFLITTAFFGTGNIASINSFDPSSVYCFLTVFNPFVMGALLMWKVITPFIFVSCVFCAIRMVLNIPIRNLLLLVLIMSDIMGLHFFFMVRDYGSWLDIGTSISHYVIVMGMITFVMLLMCMSYFLTTVTLLPASRKKHIQ